MADITPTFNTCLQAKHSSTVRKQSYDLNQINSFLQEAYSINARIADLTRELRSIRPAYLSIAPPPRKRQLASSADGPRHNDSRSTSLTHAEREAIDAQSKLLLRQLNGAITGLQQAESVRTQTADSVTLSKRARGGLGALGRWAAGGAVTAKSPEEEREEAERKTVAAVRESVVLYLQRKLEEAGRLQSEMMEVRLGREVEKNKSLLYKSRAQAREGGVPYALDEGWDANGAPGTPMSPSGAKRTKRQSTNLSNGSISSPATQDTPPQLSEEQLQLFASENADLLKRYEDQLDQVRTAEMSILEISDLHSTLHANLQQQSEHIDQLVQDSYLTTENLGKGNKELKRASERKSTARMLFWGTVGFCTFLVGWDLVF